MDAKTKEQEHVKKLFRKHNYSGLYLGCTGCGKTKIAIDLLVESVISNPKERWLIVIPTENLRDNEWRNEFIKWGYEEYLSKVRIECIQTAYKYFGNDFNVVVDEVDTTLSPEYKSLYEGNKINKLMCFTAAIDDQEKMEYITSLVPLLHVTDVNRATRLGITSPYMVYNFGIAMSDENAARYKTIMEKYNYLEHKLGGPWHAFSNSSKYMADFIKITPESRTDVQKELLTNSYAFWGVMQNRKALLYNASEKLAATTEILKKYSDRKAIVFCETINFAKKLQDYLGSESVLFHSEMTKNERKDALKMFESPLTKTRVITSVKALNRGFNVPECSLGICASGNSTWIDTVQRQGRVTRLQEGKLAIYFNLYLQDTQEVKWVSKRTEKINKENVRWITSLEQI